MGQRQDKDEIVYGNDCLTKFNPGQTPKDIYVRFSKVVACPISHGPPPNDRAFKLTQNPAWPCEWIYNDGTWWINFLFVDDPVSSQTNLWYWPTKSYYFDGGENLLVDEGHVFANRLGSCGGVVEAIGGIMVVTWRLESLNVMGLLNIKTQYDLFMEMRPLEDSARVYKYCKLKDATNIAIKYDPD